MRKLKKVVPFGLAVMMSLQGIYPAVPVMADTVKVAATKKSTSSATVLSKKERAKIMQQINAMSPEEGLKLAKKKGLIKEDTNAKESNLKKATVNKDAKEGEVGYQFTQDQYVDETHRIRYSYIVTGEGTVSADLIRGIIYENGKPKTNENGADCSYTIEDTVTYPSEVTLNGTTYQVKTAVFDNMFEGNITLKDVVLPEGIEECDGVGGASSMTSLTIPSTLKKIGPNFGTVSSFHRPDYEKMELSIRDNSTFQGYKMSDPKKSKYFTVQDGIVYNKDKTEIMTKVPCALNKETIVLPDTLKEIPDGAFMHNRTVKKVVFGKNVTKIGNGAFAYSNIENVQMNDNVTSLDEYAFYYCTKLANVDLSKSLTKIDGYETFKYTSALKHIDLKNVKELTGWYTFQQSGLEDVDLSNVESVDGIQVFGTCYNLKTVYIGKNTDLSSRLGIGCNCFAGCFKLEKYVQKEKNIHNLYVEDGKLYSSKIKGHVGAQNGEMEERTLTGKILLGYPVQMQKADAQKNNGTLKINNDLTAIGYAGLITFIDVVDNNGKYSSFDTIYSKLIIPANIEAFQLINSMPQQNLEVDVYGNKMPLFAYHCFYSINDSDAEKEDAVLGTKTIKFKTAALRDEFVEHWKEHVMYIYKGEKEVYDVLPEKKTTSITLNRTSDTFKCEGEPQEVHLIAKLSSDDCTDVVKFKSSNENVATVDGNGVVKTIAGAHGTAIITATAGDYSASYKVTVKGSGIHATGLDGSDLGSFKWDDEHGKNQLNLSDVHIYCNDCDKELEKGTDYTVSYENTDKPGKAKVTFTGINGYEGYSLSYTYTILPNSFTIDESLPACRWKGTGKEHKVDLTGKVTHWNPYKGEKTTLVEGKDYRLEYSDNTKIGTAKVKVIGLGDYEGYEKILSFEIKAPHGWNGFQVNYNGDVYKDGDDLGSFDWEKDGVRPEINVSCIDDPDCEGIENGKDYSITYVNDKKPGKASIVIKSLLDGVNKTTTVHYTISPRKIIVRDGDDAILKDQDSLGIYKWTGKEVRPDLSDIKLQNENGSNLTAGTDYKIEYPDDMISEGEKTVKVIGLGDYEGTEHSYHYTIEKQHGWNGFTVKGHKDGDDLGSFDWTGHDVEPKFEVTCNHCGDTLVNGTDYYLEYSNDHRDPGKVTVKVVGFGDYKGWTQSFTYTIKNKTFSYSGYENGSHLGTVEYTGKEVTYTISEYDLKDANGESLTEGTDYKVTYSNNIDPGTANMKITGLGDYEGCNLNFTYTIDHAYFMYNGYGVNNDGADLGTVAYTGKATEYEISDVYDNNDWNNKLIEGKDYKLVYSDNTKPGTAKVEIIGLGIYAGCDLTFTYTIVDQDAMSGFSSNLYADGSDIGSYAYTGEEVKPSLGVIYGNQSQSFLVEGVDYKIEYSNNVNPGTATAKVIGIGRFTGKELTFTYTIKNKSFVSKDHKDGENLGTLKWTGKEQKMDVGSFYDPVDGHTLVEGKDYKLVYSDHKDAGTAKVKVIGLGYYDGSELSFTYTIEKQHGWNGFYSKGHKDGESLGTFKWTGNTVLIDPDMRCSHCDKELQENVDYKVEYTNNIDPGVASMKIIGMGDYKGRELNFTFVIEKKAPTTTEDQKPTTTTTETKPTTGTTENSSATSETKPTTSTTETTTTTTTEDTTTTTETRPTESSTTTETKPSTSTTETASTEQPTTAVKQKKKLTSVSGIKNATYTGKTIKCKITVRSGKSTLKENKQYKVTYKNNKNCGIATIKITGIGDYQGTITKTFKIAPKKATIHTVKAAKKAANISIRKNDGGITGYQISYSYKKNFKGQKYKELKKCKYKKIKVKRKKYTITSYKVKGLKRKKTVYVRVRAYKQVGKTKVYGEWSRVKKVKIK